MRFDDRLKTVITQPVVDLHDRVVRWRQLVDLLARLPDEHDEAMADAGFALIERELPVIPQSVRAASARHAANYPLDLRVVALFARDNLAVAAPVLASANLSAMEWHDISRDCGPDVANFIRSLGQTMIGARRAELTASSEIPSSPIENATSDDTPSISQMVARIEQLRSRRGSDVGDGVGAERQFGQPSSGQDSSRAESHSVMAGEGLFRWESDEEGRIRWVEGAPRGALVGQALTEVAQESTAGLALLAREPFAGVTIELDGPAVAGEWQMSGLPAFSPVDGRFMGYRGLARKPGGKAGAVRPSHASSRKSAKPQDLDALRETIHEIKTPLNAIIGFAEIIDGQYLGPAHRNYRRRAAEIVAQARMLLEAVQDLDMAARLQTEVTTALDSARLAEILRTLEPELVQAAMRADATLSIVPGSRDERIVMSSEMGIRLLRRFLGSVVGASSAGERLSVSAERRDRHLAVAIARPINTSNLSSAQLMDPGFSTDSREGQLLGLGFALRLVRGLVRLVDGDLLIEDARFVLLLPSP